MNEKKRNMIALVLRIGLGVVFVWAAVSKIADPQGFMVTIKAYSLPLPDLLVRLTAVVLPWLELLTGLVLLFGLWAESSLALIATMLAVFIVATGQAWARGLDINCGCFGSDLEETTFLGSVAFAFFRNIVLFAIAGWLWTVALKAGDAKSTATS